MAVESPARIAVLGAGPIGLEAALYARYGIRHYWVIDPDARTLEIYETDGAQYRSVECHEGHATVRTAVFPDLEIDLGRVWV